MRAHALLALALPFALACGTSATSGSDGGAGDGPPRADGSGAVTDGGGLDGSIDPGGGSDGGTDGGPACACLPDPPVTGSTIAVHAGGDLQAALAQAKLGDEVVLDEGGADAQAVAGWNGPGPFDIVDDELDASGENILFGGSDPQIAQLIPSDIRILYNHVDKPLSWRVGDPSYAGTHWSVKNSIEL